MAIQTHISTLLQKKMDRQDFLKHVAIGVVALSGAGAALRMLAPKQHNAKQAASGYGASAYGGITTPTSQR